MALDGADSAERIAHAFAAGDVVAAHTSEATLADVFRAITGKALEGAA